MAATTLSDRPRPATVSASLEARVLDAALRCVARWGVAKTTLDDVAREAGCSRASVYRAFPGGKDLLMQAAGEQEVARLLDEILRVLAEAPDLLSAVSDALVAAVRTVRAHAALQYLVEHEPGTVLPYVSFDGLDPLLGLATDFVAPPLTRFVPEVTARPLAELLARLVVSHAFEPSPFVDLADADDARRFVAAFVLPGILADHDHVTDLTAATPTVRLAT